MTTAGEVKQSVLAMYMEYPYPSYSKLEREQIFAAELSRYRFLGLDEFLPGARVIDVGCGTAHRVMPIAQYFGVQEYVGLDHSTASLAVAEELSKELRFDRVQLVQGDVFEIPFPESSFDVVISQGVLHHTSDPRGGFAGLVKLCRPGGFVDIYLYNKWNHWRHNLQKARVSRLGGDDIHRRFEVAHELYGKKRIEEMTPAEIAGFYDQYCHPHKSDHTIGETMQWFREEGLQYWGSYPPLRMRNFVAMAQFRGDLKDRYPHFHTSLSATIVALASMLPRARGQQPPFKAPTVLHQFFWQLMYAIQGAGGRYSGGPALCGRKRDQ